MGYSYAEPEKIEFVVKTLFGYKSHEPLFSEIFRSEAVMCQDIGEVNVCNVISKDKKKVLVFSEYHNPFPLDHENPLNVINDSGLYSVFAINIAAENADAANKSWYEMHNKLDTLKKIKKCHFLLFDSKEDNEADFFPHDNIKKRVEFAMEQYLKYVMGCNPIDMDFHEKTDL